MKNNTVVVACDKNYFWGTFLLVASMRKFGMDEPVLVFQSNFSQEMKDCLSRFGDIRFVDAPPSVRNMAARKGEAMLCATTDYITWVDCDGFFYGNCSDLLIEQNPDTIHARLRSPEEMMQPSSNKQFHTVDDIPETIPKHVLETWKKDVGDLSEPAIKTTITSCFFSLHKKHRDFIERWQEQMNRVLPDKNSEVTWNESIPYYQFDESVLNSLLCFMRNAPVVAPVFKLDKDRNHIFHHMVLHPKPWQWWNPSSLRAYDRIMEIIRWAIENGYATLPLPLAFNPQYSWLHRHTGWWSYIMRAKKKLLRKLKV
ncbi:MAG: hypothetical protein IKP58_08100 [Victivallales bacterium]|nr:hypothetical protein [Victivallales bacterium]